MNRLLIILFIIFVLIGSVVLNFHLYSENQELTVRLEKLKDKDKVRRVGQEFVKLLMSSDPRHKEEIQSMTVKQAKKKNSTEQNQMLPENLNESVEIEGILLEKSTDSKAVIKVIVSVQYPDQDIPSGEYQVRLHLIRESAKWKVSDYRYLMD